MSEIIRWLGWLLAGGIMSLVLLPLLLLFSPVLAVGLAYGICANLCEDGTLVFSEKEEEVGHI